MVVNERLARVARVAADESEDSVQAWSDSRGATRGLDAGHP